GPPRTPRWRPGWRSPPAPCSRSLLWALTGAASIEARLARLSRRHAGRAVTVEFQPDLRTATPAEKNRPPASSLVRESQACGHAPDRARGRPRRAGACRRTALTRLPGAPRRVGSCDPSALARLPGGPRLAP